MARYILGTGSPLPIETDHSRRFKKPLTVSYVARFLDLRMILPAFRLTVADLLPKKEQEEIGDVLVKYFLHAQLESTAHS
jgi:hypothetical protein